MAFLGMGFVASLSAAPRDNAIVAAAASAETQLHARVGVAVLDTATGKTWQHRADERFPLVSTFKTLACAALLDDGAALAEQTVTIHADDVLPYAPVTKSLVNQSLPAQQLCAITLRTSDNTAANKLLDVVGGPAAVTAFLRRIGDSTTRLDRNEPTVNESRPGDERDTTTPRAMSETMNTLLLGSALAPPQRATLVNWLKGNEVGGPLLRAGVPASWVVADRTGAGDHGTRAVAAVLWPPGRAPIVASVYITETDAPMEARNVAIAAIGRAIGEQFER